MSYLNHFKIEPTFEREQIHTSKIFDKEGNEYPAVITFWIGGKEIKEVKVSVKSVDFSDFNYDVREAIYKRFGRGIEIKGEIELI